ncbi:MAG: UDP-N-acetylmuramate--L-alanine ligase [Candidatus Atribacteria bacterium]|nr:UDP-N-acetylmuramate--L-alanine ligase [Candidatus Atribacteria bacterium]
MNLEGKHIHFIGIGGAGMSGIASILLDLGYEITGSDLQRNNITRRLINKGAMVYKGHDSSHIDGANLVVVSSAINGENQEVIAARENHIKIIPRAEMLSRIMDQKHRIAVSGTHGKTTTTSMTSLILNRIGLDPTIAIGGEVNDIGGNGKLGKGDYVVVEADESDGSFLLLNPNLAIVTNIENDHLDYYNNIERTIESFGQFVNKVPDDGSVIFGYDCENVRRLINKNPFKQKVITYGFHPDAQMQALNPTLFHNTSNSDIYYKQQKLGSLSLNVPGYHNISNAMAAISATMQLGIKFKDIQDILYDFKGVKRRQELIANIHDVFMIIDDYGHHPSEIKATLKAIRMGWPKRRMITVFQPHRYSRTKLLLDQFGYAFQDSDLVVINEIYPANEKPIENISAELVYRKVKENKNEDVYYIPKKKETVHFLMERMIPGDIIITMGAGDVWKVGKDLAKELAGIDTRVV